MTVGCEWRYRPEPWPMAYSKEDRAFDRESANRTEGYIYQQYKQWRKWISFEAIGYVPFNFNHFEANKLFYGELQRHFVI